MSRVENLSGRLIGALLILLASVLGLAACGDDAGSKGGGACKSGQKFAEVNGAEGCYDVCDQGQCSNGYICASGICVGQGGNNGNPNNGTSNNGTSNNGTPNNGVDPAAEALCIQACDLLYGSCISNNCTLAPEDQTALANLEAECLDAGDESPTCAEEATDDAGYRTALEQFVTQTCDDLETLRCGEFGLTQECGCSTPVDLGAACTDSASCDGGSLAGFCLTETNSEGDQTGFVGGYCFAEPCPEESSRTAPYAYESSACGPSGICSVRVDSQGQSFSLCQAGCGNCRSGYACQIVGLKAGAQANTAEFLRSCFPICEIDADCGENGKCLNQACAAECSTGPIGDVEGNPSLADACASSGGTCSNGFCNL